MLDNTFRKSITSIWKKPIEKPIDSVAIIDEAKIIHIHEPQSNFIGGSEYNFMFAWSYNGEKNLGEIGPIKNYRIDYEGLRMRSWQSFIESEITQTVVKRYAVWVIGKGLKLQAEPKKKLLESESIALDIQEFSNVTEERFSVYRETTMADYSDRENLDMVATTALINSIVGGDVLVVLRYDTATENVTVQLIDGAHLQSPIYGTEWYPQSLPSGNQIINGIEINQRKEHVAYWVRTGNTTTGAVSMAIERIPVKGANSGMKMAYLITGLKFRIDNMRTMPLIAVVLESLKKLERYKEATIGSAEEIAKISYQIIHKEYSDGSPPFGKHIQKAFNAEASTNDLPTDNAGKAIANSVAVSTNKQAFNMPTGSEIKTINQPNGTINFKDFYTPNVDIICSCLEIPPNVAMSKYDANFSASRAALKDWEHTLGVKRKNFSFQFYQPIYNFWLETQILQNKIKAPGYISARIKNNLYVLAAFRNARWIGAPVPHIDPLKEVKAEREKLGSKGALLPLTTLEAATESLGGGESVANLHQFSEELINAEKLKIILPTKLALNEPPKK